MNFEPMYDGALVTCSGADRNKLTFSANLKESPRGVDFVQENGPERVGLKLNSSKIFQCCRACFGARAWESDKENTHISCRSQLSFWRANSRRLCLVVGTLVIFSHCLTWSQTAPMSPNLSWHSSQESSICDEAKQVASGKFTVNTASTYSLAELIDAEHDAQAARAQAMATRDQIENGRVDRILRSENCLQPAGSREGSPGRGYAVLQCRDPVLSLWSS